MIKTNLLKILQGGALAACVALILGFAALPGYSQYSCTPSSSVSVWIDHFKGNWDNEINWNPTVVPNSASATVCIVDGSPAAPTTVILDALSPTVDTLVLNNENTLLIGNPSVTLTLAGPTISNAGTIVIAGELSAPNSISLQGGGTVKLTGGNLIEGAFFGGSLTNVDNTIQGYGKVAGLQESDPILNERGGTVDATVAGQTLVVGGALTNNGSLGATAGSTLDEAGTLTNFSNGTLAGGTWDANGTIQLSALGSSGGEITTNNANIILDGGHGGAAAIVDDGGENALSALANNEGTLTIENGVNRTFSTNLTNSGTINVGSGAGMGVSANLTNSGTINVGPKSSLTLTGGYSQTALGSTNVNGGLEFSGGQVQLGFSSLTVGQQGEALYMNGATVVGGFLTGSGRYVVGPGGASFVGTTIDNGPAFLVISPSSFTNVTNNGAISIVGSTTLKWNGGSNADSGSLTVADGGTANVTSFTSSGVMTITGTGVVANSGTNLTLGGGSRTYIGSKAAPGGTLSTVAGTTIELNGGLLDNNGTVSGTLDVNYGSLAEGAGVYGAVNVTNGGAFHPGNSPGIATSSSANWGAGGAYQFSINSASGTPGTNWSLWNVTGNLDITAGTTPNSQFTIDINSLLANDSPGLLANFNPDDPYTWLIASAGSITGFNAADFAFDTSGFANPLDGGAFSLADGSTGINLMFTPKGHTVTPEPASLFLLGTGLVGLAVLLRRQRVSQSA